MRIVVGPGTPDDVEAMADLAQSRRAAYAKYQPRFWNPAPDARERHAPFLASLLEGDAIVRVAKSDDAVVGFAIGTLVAAPPVYEPGGPSCFVDDFTVADPAAWPTAGRALLDAISAEAKSRGAAQVVVVTAHLDAAQRGALQAAGLETASEWWVGPL